MGGWVSPPPPPWGGVGHLSVCGYAKILGGWVPELTPPPPLGWLSKTLAGKYSISARAVCTQCARSATIWASGRSRNPYFVVLWASLLFCSRF